MPNYHFKFQQEKLTVEQVEFLTLVHLLAVKVEAAPFGSMDAVNQFREFTKGEKIEALFGEGAVEASTDVNTTGWMHFDKMTREVLMAIHHVVSLREANSFLDFNAEYNYYVVVVFEDFLQSFMYEYDLDSDELLKLYNFSN